MSEARVSPPAIWASISGKHRLIAVAVLLFFLIMSVLGYKFFVSNALAILSRIEGTADRDVAAQVEEWFEATVGDDFTTGDGARTDAESEAFFRLGTGAQLTLRPASQIRFQRSSSSGGEGAIGLHVEVGEADVQTKSGTLTIDSQFGPIVINPNTTVTMRRNGENMVVDVELGSIQIGETRQVVQAGSGIELEIGGIVVDASTSSPESTSEEVPPEEEETDLNQGDGVDNADLIVGAGDKFTVHDPSPPTAIGFRFGEICAGPGRLSSGKQETEAKALARLSFAAGSHQYELRCLDSPDEVAVQGSFRILRDAGTRQLPSFTPKAQVTTDGRRYTVMYQQRLPQVTVSWPSAPQVSSYTLKVGGRSISTKSPTYTFRSGALGAGTHRVVFSAASEPPRQSRATTVAIVYDSQAPAARVSEPRGEFDSGESVKVAGQALPGWTISIDGKELEVDSQRRFSSEYQGKGALPIAFSHPKHGMHYYLRRPRASSPP